MSDPLFQRALQDLIKGIRSHKSDPSTFVSQCIAEIKAELKSTDAFIKAETVRKLTYLQMIGYNVSWASFGIVEVMSQPRFAHKRIGYLAANQTFDESTDVILLTTNLFKKELSNVNNNPYEIGIAVNCLANIATKDLAVDCMQDLVTLLGHSKPYVRKKAVLALYKLYVKYPQGLRLTFDRLKDCLDDTEPSVVSTAVNVICELANKNPKNYLAMAPKFFRLLTTSSNNWMLIKVVKLLGSLVSEEPRLARKLLEPLATIIQNTGAKSLQYECIFTVTEALPHSKREDGSEAKNAASVIKLCSDHLRGFIEESDQNLKYLGLVGLVKLMKSSPRSVVDHRDLILQCLNDDDITIRAKALELLAGIVSRKSLVDLIHHIMEHARAAEGAYRDEIISKILFMCRKEKYSLVEDFAWYTTILLELAKMQGTKHGLEVADQLIEITLRVDTVRPFMVESMLSLLFNNNLISSQARLTVYEVLRAAAWIVGEYCDIVSNIVNDQSDNLDDDNDEEENEGFWIDGPSGEEIRSVWRGQQLHLMILECLLHPRATNLPHQVQMVFLQSATKLFVRSCTDCEKTELADIIGIIRSRISVFTQSPHLEIQERANSLRYILAEFGILPIDWEESLEENIKTESEKAAAAVNLLEFPSYTPSSLKAIDENGAKIAKEKHAVLNAMTIEKFFAVHPKAQKRVPVPEDVSLDNPLNSSELRNMLSIEIPDNLQLSSLSLLSGPVKQTINFEMYENEEDAQLSKAASNSFNTNYDTGENMRGNSTEMVSSGVTDINTVNSGVTTKNSDDIYYLSSNNKAAVDIIPLAKILGEHFEDIPDKKKSKDKKRRAKKQVHQINVSDALPAGAVSSEDESKKNAESNRRKKKADKEVNLESVDITTPLRADEVFTVPTHRVVPEKDAVEDKEKHPKTKHKKSSKKHHHSDTTAGNVVHEINLLGIDLHGEEKMVTPHKDTLPEVHHQSTKVSGNKIYKTKVLHSSHSYWWQLHQDAKISIVYNTIATESNNVKFNFKTTNLSSDDSIISCTLQLHPSSWLHLESNQVQLATNLHSQMDCIQSLIATAKTYDQDYVIKYVAVVTIDSLLGLESLKFDGDFRINFCDLMTPNVINAETFTSATSNSTGMLKQTADIQCSKKAKSLFKALGALLHSHTVDMVDNAATYAAKHNSSSTFVYILVKAKEPSKFSVEVKAHSRSNDCNRVLSAIINRVAEIEL